MQEVLIFIALTAAIAAGVVVLVRRAAAARGAALRETAARLGWGFQEEVPFTMIPDLDRFELFRLGHSKKLRNLLTSPAGNPRAVLFEYSYTISGGKSQQTHRQTVFYATSDELRLPSFSLRPENFLHRLAGAFGYQDIDLDGRPEFSRMFLLRGEHDAHVRAAFNDAVAEFFEARGGMCAAGVGRELLYWRPGRLAKPDDLETLIADGFELTRRLIGPRAVEAEQSSP
jgi:hypothetical protein